MNIISKFISYLHNEKPVSFISEKV